MLGDAAVMMHICACKMTAVQSELHGELTPLISWWANDSGHAPRYECFDISRDLLVQRVTCRLRHTRNHSLGTVEPLIFGQLDGEASLQWSVTSNVVSSSSTPESRT